MLRSATENLCKITPTSGDEATSGDKLFHKILRSRQMLLRISAVAVLLFVVLFWRLGVPTFWDPDEAHYAETSRELLRTHDWLAPYYNEQPFFEKPIMFHWLQ